MPHAGSPLLGRQGGGLKLLQSLGAPASKGCCRIAARPISCRAATLPGGGSSDGSGAASSSSGELSEAEAVRLVTAATILAASPGSSSAAADDAAAAGGSGDDVGTADGPLSLLADVQQLDADSLSLVVGILRRAAPLEAEQADVDLSARLTDLLQLLRRRPASLVAAPGSIGPGDDERAGGAAAGSAAAGGGGDSSSAAAAAAPLASFWGRPDEWADIRSALMGIGINASVDEEDEEEGVFDVAELEGGGPPRRTRLLTRLPRLDAATSAQLAAFLAELQAERRHDGPAGSAAAAQQAVAPVAERSIEEEGWWSEATAAYELLWQQARLQQLEQLPGQEQQHQHQQG